MHAGLFYKRVGRSKDGGAENIENVLRI